jgi:Fic family protein
LYIRPDGVSFAMASLIKETNEALRNVNSRNIESHPLTIATRFHFVFLNRIHPFGDGNGRIARIFMNLILLQNGFPPIFIDQIDKKLYLDCFTQEEKKAGTMLEFMTNRLIESLKAKRKHLLKKKI